MHPEAISLSSGDLGQKTSTDAVMRGAIRLIILGAVVAMAAMSWSRNINWDEFYFLSHVHAHLDGRLDRPLQTFFVHGFGWLSGVPGTEVDQIAIARVVMLGFFASTCLALHRIAAALTDEQAADVALLAFVTSGFAIAHGASFRADPMAAGLLMGAVALMMTTRMNMLQIIAVAVLSALAVLVTVKSALYLPVYIGALLWRWDERRVVLRCLAAGLLAIALSGGLFVWHASGIVVADGAGAGDNLSEAARVTLGGSGLLPRWPEISLWLMFSAGTILMGAVGLYFASSNRLRAVIILFTLPLLSVVIYRNAFPYFFPFAVPAMMVAVAIGAQATRTTFVFKLALVLMVASGAIQTQRALSEDNTAQRETLAEVHRMFPDPVTYIDQNGMVSSFDRRGFFMSTWGIATYRASGQPVFANLIARHQPPLLLANRAELLAALRPETDTGTFLGLLADDAQVLRDSYVHHAGVVWLAGQDVTLGTGLVTAQVPFAGTYRVEAAVPVNINGQSIAPGNLLTLEGGPISVSGPSGEKVRLIWNTAGGATQRTLPETGLYAGFWRL